MSSARDELYSAYPVVVTQAVAWGDMDSFQHVNNVVYFRYFENARIEYIYRIGWVELQKATGVGPILAATQARFRRPLTYPDTVHIGVRLLELKEDRFSIEYRIVSERLNDIATVGDGLLVAYHYPTNKKASLPEELTARIRAIEARV